MRGGRSVCSVCSISVPFLFVLVSRFLSRFCPVFVPFLFVLVFRVSNHAFFDVPKWSEPRPRAGGCARERPYAVTVIVESGFSHTQVGVCAIVSQALFQA